jgi:hypothetical protein
MTSIAEEQGVRAEAPSRSKSLSACRGQMKNPGRSAPSLPPITLDTNPHVAVRSTRCASIISVTGQSSFCRLGHSDLLPAGLNEVISSATCAVSKNSDFTLPPQVCLPTAALNGSKILPKCLNESLICINYQQFHLHVPARGSTARPMKPSQASVPGNL